MSMVGRTTSVVCIFLGFLCAPCHAVAAHSACGGVLPRALTAQSMGCKMASDAGGAAISIRNFDLWAGDSALLLGVQWTVMPNERWALLGPNGAGKSTLLKAIAAAARGEGSADGTLLVDSALRVGMLEQTAVSGSSRSVRDEVMSRMSEFNAASAELEAATAACVSGADCELERLEAAQIAFAAAGGYEIEARVSRVLQGLGFDQAEFDRPCDSFSGGWQMRIGLARLLLSEPELLIMDEPTNHLDASARRWLGDYISSYAGTVLVVTHDEEFVAAAANSLVEVTGGRLELYKSTTYPKYLAEREERQARARATVEAQQREAKRLQDFIDRMGAKASKASQAKDRAGKLSKLESQMAEAERLVVGARQRPKLTLAPPPSCGAVPVALRGACLRHPQGSVDIITDADLEVTKGMRLVLRGPNGAGKSTLVKALAATLELRSGDRFEDERLALGFFAQDLAQELPQEQLASEYVASVAQSHDASISDERCRSVLGALGLSGDKGRRVIGQLSGGEKARVALATFCLTPCNVLILDEPTNHLDVDAVAALLDAIKTTNAAIVVVSHDRSFCEAIDCSHVGYVCDGRVTVEERALRPSDFSEADRGVRNVATEADASTAAPAESKEERMRKRQQQKELSALPKKMDKVEAAIADAEANVAALEKSMLEIGADAGRAIELSAERDAAQAKVDDLYAQWEALEAAMRQIEADIGVASAR